MDNSRNGSDRGWTTKEYEILQITICGGFVARFREVGREKTVPLAGVALARVKESAVVAGDGGKWKIERETEYREIVGLLLENGHWSVAAEDEHYIGMYRVDERVNEVAVLR